MGDRRGAGAIASSHLWAMNSWKRLTIHDIPYGHMAVCQNQ